MAQEYLLSGLVVPEYTFKTVGQDFARAYNIKKKPRLVVPDSMWLRDPKAIKIYTSLLSDRPSYFIKIPDEFIQFIQNKGEFPNGQKRSRAV